MKKITIIIFSIFTMVSLYAQPPGGGGGGRGMGGPPPGGMRQPSNFSSNKPILDHFPEIPDLTLKQREKVGTILTNEREDIQSQLEKRREIEMKLKPDTSDKEREKQKKNIDKIDKKIRDIKEKSDKKIKKELSDTQYQVFIEKREEFRFKEQHQRPQPRDMDGSRPPFPDGFGEDEF